MFSYQLTNPNYTIFHRAAMGGLASTIYSWGPNQPDGIHVTISPTAVSITKDEAVSARDAVQRILEASFLTTPQHLILLPGQGIPPHREDLRVATHGALCGTFLQHNMMRPAPKSAPNTMTVSLKDSDDETGSLVSYKPVGSYAHQRAQSTGLLDSKDGSLPSTASIQQWMIPGALKGVKELEVSADEAFLLLFLMVSAQTFYLRPHRERSEMQYAVIIPDVVNLERFARQLPELASQNFRTYSASYSGRVTATTEEAALKFLLDLKQSDTMERSSVSGCLALTMGKVAWDRNQINRSGTSIVTDDYAELPVFRSAAQHYPPRTIKLDDGGVFVVPGSPLPGLVASNLAAGRHWASGFTELVADQNDFEQLARYRRKGLIDMKENIRDEEDRLIIDTFHEAWRRKQARLGERERRDASDFSRLVEVERERVRNEILREKSAAGLAGWFLRFCADATRGGSLPSLRQHGAQIRKLIFREHDFKHFERLQNLFLFALLSYSRAEGELEPEIGTELVEEGA